MRMLELSCYQFSFVIYSSVYYIYHVIYYISSTYNWKFVSLDHLHLIPHPSSPALGNHKFGLFFYEFVCLYLKYS